MTFDLSTFSAHQRRCDMRFFIVPADKSSAFQCSTNASTCFGFKLVACMLWNPKAWSWFAISVKARSRSDCVPNEPSWLRQQSCLSW